MSQQQEHAIRYLASLSRRTGARHAVLADREGLLIAGTGAPTDALEELAVYAPSQRPAKLERPAKMQSCRVELGEDRVYLATDGSPIPAGVADELARILG